MLVSLNEVMEDAIKNGYAVGAFNVTNYESLVAIIQAAEETEKGVILNFAEVHSPLITLEEIGPLMVMYAKKASVPVCVHLDHGTSIESCIKAIQLGFSSVMLDASSSCYEENVRETQLIVRLAHSVGVTVEAELGHILASDIGLEGSSENIETADSFEKVEDIYTDPDTARDFSQRTGIDALAIAFGTAHGVYTVKPVLDLDRIAQIRKVTDVPLVMHGGSGLTREEFQTAIHNGIRKVNYYTYMSLTGGAAVKKALDQKAPGENIFFHELPLIGIQAMKEDVKNAIRIFSLES